MGALTTFFQRRGERDPFPVSFHDDHDFVSRTELRTFTDGENLKVVTFPSRGFEARRVELRSEVTDSARVTREILNEDGVV